MNISLKLSIVAIGALLLSACGGGGDSVSVDIPDTQNSATSDTVYKLAPQNGTQSQLFYGNSKHSALGTLSNSSVIDPNNTGNKIASKDTIETRYPGVTTSCSIDANNSYSDLHTQSISYVSNSQAYVVSMAKGDTETKEMKNSSVIASGFSYIKMDYAGSKQYLVADDKLITPDMSENDTALEFKDKTLLTLSYPSFGAEVNGYIVYDSNRSTLQNCTTDMLTCTDIEGMPTQPRVLGDVGGTAKSVLYADHRLFMLDKASSTISEIGAGKVTPRRTSSVPYTLNGESIYYLENQNIYKVDFDGNVSQISTDGKADRLRAFTNDMVIYGGDDQMHAVYKDGSNKESAIEISVTTKTRGQKYPFDLGIGKQYLYTTYSVNPATGKNTFSACVLEDGKKECREDSYWSAVTAAKNGTLNFTSSYRYTPYAYVRVDNPDNYGGGEVKAIDPKYPLADGIAMGTIETFNFQTFVNSSYDNELIDSDGYIVLYAKNDLDYRGDAFLMNLREENSLQNLTNEEAPTIDALTEGRDHCHGRRCSVCHSFAGGKIYVDKKASASAHGYNIRFDFEDGSESILAKIRKGSGENFNTPLESLTGKNFKAVVVDKNGTDIVKSIGYYHKGAEFFNCNHCHNKNGLLNDAPNVITIED